MKKLFLATTALVVLAATSAGAADMYARPAYAPPPPPLPVYSWTGLYFGGNVGYRIITPSIQSASEPLRRQASMT